MELALGTGIDMDYTWGLHLQDVPWLSPFVLSASRKTSVKDGITAMKGRLEELSGHTENRL